MALPNSDLAVVERTKIVDYLLNPAHPDNGGQARFFFDLGFRVDQWELLASALRSVATDAAVWRESKTIHGVKYVVDGAINTLGDSTNAVRTVWIIEAGQDAPRLVTAYPRP